jgi:AcrR family transcriptional regulator
LRRDSTSRAAAGNAGRRPSGPVQKERSERSRERVLLAAIELIADGGLSAATGQKIAARSGISWGGIQHQFGGKAGILEAVLTRVLSEFDERLGRFSTPAESIEERVEAWVDASWTLHRDSTYRAFREVMRGPSSGGPGLDPATVLTRVASALEAMRRGLFPEIPLRTLELMNLVLFATLAGMADQAAYGLVEMDVQAAQLAVLEKSLTELARNGPSRRGGG